MVHKEIKIIVDCKDDNGLDMILDRIVSQIKEGYREGFDRNEYGSYRYTVSD